MDEHIFTRVKINMKSKHFTFNESWLRECVQYCVKTQPKMTIEGIQSFAVEQWLLSDLHEINSENGCLPKNLIEQRSTMLYGCYILQMQKMYDISTSKYKQLNKIRNVNIENLKATKEEKSEISEPKGNRMYQLHLSDGLQEIQAIEYKPINLFNDVLLPGSKLKLIGPVTCRRGIILLEKENIAILGGEVEDLLIKNSVENVLARFLNLDENPNPFKDVMEEKECEKIDLEEEFLSNLVKLQQSQDSKGKDVSNSLVDSYHQSVRQLNTEERLMGQDKNSSDDELEALLNDPDLIYEFPSVTVIPTVNDNSKKAGKFTIPSEASKQNQNFNLDNLSNNRQYENDVSRTVTRVYEDRSALNKNHCESIKEIKKLDEKIDFFSNSGSLLKSWNTGEPKISNLATKNEVKFTENKTTKDLSNSQISDDLILIDEDLIIIENKSDIGNDQKFSKSQEIEEIMKIDFDSEIRKLRSDYNRGEILDKNTTFDEVDKNKISLDSDENDKWKIPCNGNKIFNESPEIKSDIIKRPKSLGFKAFQNKLPSENETKLVSKPFKPLFPKFNSETEIKSTDSELFSNGQTKTEITSSSVSKETSEYENENIKISKNNIDMQLKKLLNVTNKSDPEKSPTGTKRFASAAIDSNSHQCKTPRVAESEGIVEIEEKMEITDEGKYPKTCDLICDLVVMTLTDQVIFKTIKAIVIENDKLSNKGGVWKLLGVITDGTANIKVEFSSQFMEKVLGISPLDFSALKKQAKTDSQMELKLKYILRNGQDKLMEAKWLMHLDFEKNKVPSVMEGFELTGDEKEIFQKRLEILNSRLI